MKTSPGTGQPSSPVSPGGCSVGSKQSVRRKTILAAPVAAYTSSHPEADQQQLATLHQLVAQYQELKQQHKTIQDQTKIISRQIGEARRGGLPVEPLKASMREHGTRLKAVTAQLGTVEDRILACFEPEENCDDTAQQAPTLPERHVYPGTADAGNEVTIEMLGVDPQDWNRYVQANPAASIYHRAEWRDLIQATFGHAGHYFMARTNDGRVTGILPLIHLNSRLFGNFMVSMPYFNYGGAIADHPAIEQQLIQAANDHAARLGVSHIEYRDDLPREGLPVRATKVNMILPLPQEKESLWKGFTPKLRAQIRRARREHPRVSCGGAEFLDDFYAVFARNMRDLGTPVYGRQFFSNILHTFPAQSRLMVMHLDKRPVAAGFLVGHRSTLEIPWASALRDVNHLGMNMLLYWSVLEFAVEQEYRQFDFGRSSRDSGTFRFKQQWGARPRQLYWHYWLNAGEELPALNPDNPKYALAINLWRRLPLAITNRLGPSIVKNLP